MTIDPEMLAAYADGELSPADAAKVEEAIAAHPDLAKQVEAHRALRAQLASAFRPDPRGARARQADGPPETEGKRAGHRPGGGAPRPRGRTAAGCASYAAALGAGRCPGGVAGPWGRGGTHCDPVGPVVSEDGQLVARGDLANALTTQLASAQDGKDVRILISFEARDGHYCRGYEQGATAGIACREGSDWRIIRTQAGMSAKPQGSYAQASSQAAEIMACAPRYGGWKCARFGRWSAKRAMPAGRATEPFRLKFG